MKELPEGWKIVELNQVFDIKKGKKVALLEKYEQNAVPYVVIENLRGAPISKYSCESKGLKCKPEDILLVWDGANCGTVGSGLSGFVGSTISRLRLISESVYKEYALLYLRSKFHYFNSNTTGATIPHLDKKIVTQLKIPLPPLSTQKEIVSILEQAEKLREWRKEADELADEFLKSIFLEIFGDPGKNPKGWDIKSLEELCLQTIDCPHSTPKHEGHVSPFPCIRTTELKNGYIDWTSMKYVSEEGYKERTKRLVPSEGDIVYGREGTFGEAVRIPKNTNICLGQRVMLFRPNSNLCNSEFLWALLRSDGIYQQAIRKTSGSTVGHVNVKDIKKFICFCPPISLQEEFSNFINSIESIREYQRCSHQEIDTLFNALMQKAFRGELVC